MNQERFFTTRELEEKYGLAKGYLKKLRMRGGGPPYRRLAGKKVVYLESEFQAWVESQRFQHTSQYRPRKH